MYNTNSSHEQQTLQSNIGGKRARADNGGGSDRIESNKLFRGHKLRELKNEAVSLRNDTTGKISMFKKEELWSSDKLGDIFKKLLFFGGGGSTDKDVGMKDGGLDKNEVCRKLLMGGESFGLNRDAKKSAIEGSKKSKKKDKKQKEDANIYNDVISDSGKLNYTNLFGNANPVHIELGSGMGSWITSQSNANKGNNYISVEMRHDRVAQTFSGMCLNGMDKLPVNNMAVVGAECCSFLKNRVEEKSVNVIYCNHPEPPTQDAREGSDGAHMLNEETLLTAIERLEGDGKGRFIIVSDNLFYCKALCKSLTEIMNAQTGKETQFCNDDNIMASYGSNMRRGEVVTSGRTGSVTMLVGQPGKSLGYVEGSGSYFDRLWQTGAGSHASSGERFIIALRTGAGKANAGGGGGNAAVSSGGGGSSKPYLSKSSASAAPRQQQPTTSNAGGGGSSAAPAAKEGGGGKNKKKSDAKQARRNARRLAEKGETPTNIPAPAVKGAVAGKPAAASVSNSKVDESGLSKDELKRMRKIERRAAARAEAAANGGTAPGGEEDKNN